MPNRPQMLALYAGLAAIGAAIFAAVAYVIRACGGQTVFSVSLPRRCAQAGAPAGPSL